VLGFGVDEMDGLNFKASIISDNGKIYQNFLWQLVMMKNMKCRMCLMLVFAMNVSINVVRQSFYFHNPSKM
jgi:hypothetical protein